MATKRTSMRAFCCAVCGEELIVRVKPWGRIIEPCRCHRDLRMTAAAEILEDVLKREVGNHQGPSGTVCAAAVRKALDVLNS